MPGSLRQPGLKIWSEFGKKGRTGEEIYLERAITMHVFSPLVKGQGIVAVAKP